MTQQRTLTANDIRFGVEIETIAPNTLHMNIGSYHCPIAVDFLPAGWKAGHDGSIETRRGYRACEIVSPILKGADGLNQVYQVCKTLQAKGFKVNESTGVHVSVDWGRQTSSEAMARLITGVSYIEDAIYAITGTHNRETGRWCNSVKQYQNVSNAHNGLFGCRYHLLNLTNLSSGEDRVEFRAFSGSLNPVKIIGWIQVCVGLVQKAKNGVRRAKWDRKKNPEFTARAFQNQESTYALFTLRRYLGWYPFQIKKGKSNGLIDGSPIPREEIIHEFTRLINKYEGENA